MEETCRVVVIGDSLFTETLAHMLAGVVDVKMVGAGSSQDKVINAVANENPDVIIIADVGISAQDASSSIISIYPDIPIIYADLNQDHVKVITSRRVSARREELLMTIHELFKQTRQD